MDEMSSAQGDFGGMLLAGGVSNQFYGRVLTPCWDERKKSFYVVPWVQNFICLMLQRDINYLVKAPVLRFHPKKRQNNGTK
jgi:hypothetical protein